VSRWPQRAHRALLAGPVAAISSLATLVALARCLPPGDGGADGIAIAMILLPVIWAGAFLYALLAPALWRVWLVLLAVLVVDLLVVSTVTPVVPA